MNNSLSIRKDIALDFGLMAGGFAPTPKTLPVSIAQRINAKYPPMRDSRTITLNPMALKVSRRYYSLFVK